MAEAINHQRRRFISAATADPHARYFGTELSERSLVPSDGALLGETRFEDWLSQSASQN